MKLKTFVQAAVLIGSMFVISACHRTATPCCEDNTWRGGAVASNDADQGARTAGIGDDEGRFGGDVDHQRRLANKNTYYFDYDRSEVHEQDKPSIQSHADRIIARNEKAVVEGHTDPRGSREYNVALGERRANAVAEELKNKGVRPDNVRVLSYGAQRLASTGNTEADYQQDRRAILKN